MKKISKGIVFIMGLFFLITLGANNEVWVPNTSLKAPKGVYMENIIVLLLIFHGKKLKGLMGILYINMIL